MRTLSAIALMLSLFTSASAHAGAVTPHQAASVIKAGLAKGRVTGQYRDGWTTALKGTPGKDVRPFTATTTHAIRIGSEVIKTDVKVRGSIDLAHGKLLSIKVAE